MASGKTGLGIEDVLEAVVQYIPHPTGDESAPMRALIFDSWFDAYRGVVILVRVVDGKITPGDKIRLMHNGKEFDVLEVGAFSPHPIKLPALQNGEVGFVIANIKVVADAKVGDTVTSSTNPTNEPLPGFKEVRPMVFAGIFPIESHDYENLRDALQKLALNDSALIFEPETSQALGFGYRCGFLGLLHMDIVQERLEREFNLDLLTTAPTVVYKAHLNNGDLLTIDNPSRMPDPSRIDFLEEPYVRAHIHTPTEYVGALIKLCEDRRGEQVGLNYATPQHVVLEYVLPLAEIVFDFFDRLKSMSRGYASLDYHVEGYRQSKLVKVDILLNAEPVDALSIIVHSASAHKRGKIICEKMKEIIQRQQYQVAIQAAIGGKIIARETISALRKDVTAKCYGGDITRKRKLLEKQKKGKKRMRQVGTVEVPQAAFLSVLKID